MKPSAEPADDVPVRRADPAAGQLMPQQRNANGALLPNWQRVKLFPDGAVVDHFRALAGACGDQTLINGAPKQAMQAESIEAVVRQAIREELRCG